MRLVHIFLRVDKQLDHKRWSYRSYGRTPQHLRTQAAMYCSRRNKAEGRT